MLRSEKTGAVLRTSTPINELWANTNGECKIHNDGDPVVVYDQLAQRWLISQFIARPSGNAGDDQYGECIAVYVAKSREESDEGVDRHLRLVRDLHIRTEVLYGADVAK